MTTTERPLVAPDELGGLDLADPRVHAERDLTEFWRHMRTNHPVHREPPRDGRPGYWVVSRYEDAVAVYKDRESFTTEGGNALGTLLHGGDSAGGHMLAVTDGERHDRIRGLLHRAFSARALEALRASLRRTVDGLITAALETGEVDWAHDVAGKVPLGAVCDLLDIPESDRAYLLGLTSHAWSTDHADEPAAESWTAKNEILMYFADLAGARRGTEHSSEHTDVVSVLANSTLDGELLSDAELIANCYGLMIGGDETGRHAISGAALALIENPEQWHALKEGRVDLDPAVEEVLRWTTPSLHGGRTATRDVRVNGELIEAGDVLAVWIWSANRDERVFAEPDRFRLDRSPNRHLSFAYGSHFCLGAYLARMEVEAVLDGMRRLVAGMERTGPAEPIYSSILNGLRTLPVSLAPERHAPAAPGGDASTTTPRRHA